MHVSIIFGGGALGEVITIQRGLEDGAPVMAFGGFIRRGKETHASTLALPL
jgi:hypothetical protein